jgi:threonine 3-dehydrogenase
MRAVFKTQSKLGLDFQENVDTPSIKTDNDVLIKVQRAGICGTDLHIYKWDDWAQHRMGSKIPLIVGHEVAGTVVEIGKNVTTLSEGDLVSAETHLACGKCYLCRTGRKSTCQNTAILGVDINGIYADYAILHEENAWLNDPNLPVEIAAVLEPLGNAFHTVLPENNIEDIVGKKVLVSGAGPIGLFTIALCKQIGAEAVYATEINPKRIALAKKMGADRVINPKEENTVKELLGMTNGYGVDVLLEISGHSQALKDGLTSLIPGGRVSLLGIFDKEVSLDLNDLIIFKGARVFGIIGRRMFETWYQLKGVLSRTEFKNKVRDVVTDQYDLKDINKAMENILEGNSAKTILKVN